MSQQLELTFPNAPAHLVRTLQIYQWIVDVCPLCGQKHTHGGGALDGDPSRLLGHRHAHCGRRPLPEPSGYILVATPVQEAA